MKSPQNKMIDTDRETGKSKSRPFMFPHSPNPITVEAENIEEATKKFEAIISNEKE